MTTQVELWPAWRRLVHALSMLAALGLGLGARAAQDEHAEQTEQTAEQTKALTATKHIYLSDLPVDERYAATENGWGPYERDSSNGELGAGDGQTISIAGTHFEKGLGVHPFGALAFVVPEGCISLHLAVGIDDEVGSKGSALFYLTSAGAKFAPHDIATKHGGEPATVVDVPVTAADTVGLRVDGTGDGVAYDHADWADAYFVCTDPDAGSGAGGSTGEEPNVIYLSDLPLSDVSNGWGPIELDSSNGESLQDDGHPLSIGGTHFAKGLGVHASSWLTVDIPAGCTDFVAQVGVDDEVGTSGSVSFSTTFTRNPLPALSRVNKRGGEAPSEFHVSLTQLRPEWSVPTQLSLFVTDNDDGFTYDHADWADAKFICPGKAAE